MTSQPLQKNSTSLKSLVESPAYANRFKQVLGERAPQFVSSLIQISGSGPLREADPHSVIAAGMIAAALDLPINPNLGFAYIIPYAGKASFQMGYKGFVQLAMRSGQLKRLNVIEVYEGQMENYDRLRGDLVYNEKNRKGDKVIGYAAYMELINGFQKAEFWSTDAVKEHATRFSQAYRKKKQDSPWFTDFDSMAKKTVLKSMLGHWSPLSVNLVSALTEDMGAHASPEAAIEFPDAPQLTDGDQKEPEKEAPPETETPKPKPTTPQAELADLFESSGGTFEDCKAFAAANYAAMKLDAVPGFADMKTQYCKILLEKADDIRQFVKEAK